MVGSNASVLWVEESSSSTVRGLLPSPAQLWHCSSVFHITSCSRGAAERTRTKRSLSSGRGNDFAWTPTRTTCVFRIEQPMRNQTANVGPGRVPT